MLSFSLSWAKKETRDYDNNPKIEDATIERHFDFRLNGSIDTENNYSSSRDYAYGYALYRDEINAQENCNADILIEQEGKDNNPHKTKYTDNNNRILVMMIVVMANNGMKNIN